MRKRTVSFAAPCDTNMITVYTEITVLQETHYRGLEVCGGQERFQGERILTRADLPTPPEPNTTSLYSRMAGLLHRTAQQSALDKRGEAK